MSVINQLPLAIALGLTLSTNVSYADTPDISGAYQCSFHDPFSTPNDGTEIIKFTKQGDVYKITETPTGSMFPYFIGKGIFNKNVNNAIGYLIWQPQSPSVTTLEMFIIKPDGSLDGLFAESNKDIIGTETCTKITNKDSNK